MKFKVDQELCIGCGACEETCPDVFELSGDTSSVTRETCPEDLEALALEAETGCPADAISHT